MWNALKDFFGFSKPVVQIPEDIYSRIEFNLGVLNHEVIKRYSVRKAMTVRLKLSSTSPKQLSDWLAECGRIVDTEAYVPEAWKSAVRVEDFYVLDDYMTEAGYVVDMKTWFADNNPRMQRVAKAFKKLPEEDRDYYQRMYNSVLRDVDSILTGIVTACN